MESNSKWQNHIRRGPPELHIRSYGLGDRSPTEQMGEAMNTKNNGNQINTHNKLLPGLIDAFENLSDSPLILLMYRNLSDKRLRLEFN